MINLLEPNLFGTDGIRAITGQFPLNLLGIISIGKAISEFIYLKNYSKKILLITDTRNSCDWLKSALCSGLLLKDVTVIDSGVLPTPAAVHILKSLQINLAIVISASHNSYEYNGIKLITKNGKLLLEDELLITQLANNANLQDFAPVCGNIINQDLSYIYKENIKAAFQENFLLGTSIVVDCANGATSHLAQEIFSHFGANIKLINNSPDGFNINKNCGSTHISNLCTNMLELKADFGFAFDGDGDRIIAVNRLQEVKDGDDILYILANSPFYDKSQTVVATQISNYGLEKALLECGKKLLRTHVGDKHVCKALVENDLILGAEQSGHIIARDLIETGDSIFITLRLLQVALVTKNYNLNSFKKSFQAVINIKVDQKKDLETKEFQDLIKKYLDKLQSGRLLVRYSGTENCLRILVEHEVANIAQSLCNEFSDNIKYYI